jgi:organic hydroperoxide reductase OsmC/OhrA
MDRMLDVRHDADAHSLCVVNDAFLSAIRSVADRERIEIRECRCHISGILAPTEDGTEYVSMQLHVRLRLDEAHLPKMDSMVHDAKKKAVLSTGIRVPIVMTLDGGTSMPA